MASTAVGTLEFRTVLEPVRSRYKRNVEFIQGWADDVDFTRKLVTIEENPVEKDGVKSTQTVNAETVEKIGKKWKVNYDKLVVSVGCYSQTFGTKGVKENAYFLKDISGSRKIRKRVLECFELASLPISAEIKQQLLSFAIVGGGPTGMEFAAELHDLIAEDLVKHYPDLTPLVRISVYDVAPKVLSMFDKSLEEYATETFRREGIQIKTSHNVKELKLGLPRVKADGLEETIQNSYGCHTLTTKEEGEVGVGLCVWSTGNMTNPFVLKELGKSFRFPETSAQIADGATPRDQQEKWMIERNPKNGTIVVDDHLRVRIHSKSIPAERAKGSNELNEPSSPPQSHAVMKDVFAIGDNASIASVVLPATAQTANQQANWLGDRLNKGNLETQSFSFKNMGIMAYVGGNRGLLQTGENRGVTGRTAWIIWRGAYMTMSVSWRNKILIPTYWYATILPFSPFRYLKVYFHEKLTVRYGG